METSRRIIPRHRSLPGDQATQSTAPNRLRVLRSEGSRLQTIRVLESDQETEGQSLRYWKEAIVHIGSSIFCKTLSKIQSCLAFQQLLEWFQTQIKALLSKQLSEGFLSIDGDNEMQACKAKRKKRKKSHREVTHCRSDKTFRRSGNVIGNEQFRFEIK